MQRILEFLIGAIVCAVAVHAFVLMGLVAPVQISAGSMAPHWLGPHWALVCGECGARYEVGADAPPQAGRTACPDCGATVLIGGAPRRDGDSLLVDRTAFLFRSPRRWEAIVFRCPTDAKRLCVKRVVGLPGERIALVDGDVYVNGRLARKSLDEQRALRVLVDRNGGLRSSWKSDAESSWSFRASDPPSIEYDADDIPRGAEPLDLLTYTVPNGGPTSDALPYNAGVPALANPTADLMLSGMVSVTGSGALVVRCGAGDGAHQIELDMAVGTVRVRHADQVVQEAGCSQLRQAQFGGRAFALELSLFDRQVIVAIDGVQCLKYPLERPLTAASTPFAIAAHDVRIRIEELTVWRDTVYTPQPGGSVAADAAQATWQLAADEHFVLGDNPAISDDSRSWRHGPGLPAKLIVGRAMRGR